MTLGNIERTTEPRPRWSEAVTQDGFRKEIASVTQTKIDMSVKSPVPHAIRLLLQQAGATVDDVNPHEFRLPWGMLYSCPKINDGDKLAKESQISKLQRIIAAGPPQPQPPEPPPLPVPAAPDDPQPAPVNIRAKIADQIKLHEAEEQRLLIEAEVHGRKVKTYQRLLEVVEEMPDAQAMLAALMMPPEPTKPELPPPPPEKITEKTQVTRQLIFVATQAFEEDFEVDQLVALMLRDKELDAAERTRVRACVAQGLVAMVERGEVIQTVKGGGKRRAKFHRAAQDAFKMSQGVAPQAQVNGATAQ